MANNINRNPTNKDISVCYHCEYASFTITDGNRVFCQKCYREQDVNQNFKDGRIERE